MSKSQTYEALHDLNAEVESKIEKAMPSDDYAQLQTSQALSALNQILFKLTVSNRRSLLAATSETMNRRQAEATVILKRLEQLNPALANQFEPEQGALLELGLRMICSPKPASGIVASFIVVSYCWHYPDWQLAPAAQPISSGWEISRPMMDFVMCLRASDDEGVWLDKLCINQNDEADKMAHIGAMDVVYRAARRVVILLEDVQLSSEEEAAGLAYSQFFHDMCREVREGGLDGLAKSEFIDEYFSRREKAFRDEGKGHVLGAAKPFLMKVIGARWFSRAWGAHESRVVPHGTVNNPLFLCFGHDTRVLTFEFRFVHYLAFIFYRTEPMPSLSGTAPFDAMYDPNPATLWQRWWRIHRFQPEDDPAVSAMQHFLSIMNLGCSMKEDLVSIALNTSAIPLVFRGSLATMEDALWIFAAVVLATGDLGPLILDGQKVRFVDDKSRDATSWLSRPIQASLGGRMPTGSVDSFTGVTREYVELDLLVFTSLPLEASQASMHKASEIITKHNLKEPGVAVPWHEEAFARNTMKLMAEHVVKDSPALWKAYLQTWLALAIDSGIDWIRRFPETMREGTEGTWFLGTLGAALDTALTDPAASLLSAFGITRDSTPDFEEEYLPTAIKFFTCLLDSRLKFLNIKPRRLPVSDNDSDNDSAVMNTTSNRSWTAIPVAVAHLPPWHKRAWIIEPFDPGADPESPAYHLPAPTREAKEGEDESEVRTSDFGDRRSERNDERGTWRLRRKEVIFGCRSWTPPVVVNGRSMVLLRKQRVYGVEDYDWAATVAALNKPKDSELIR